MKPRTIAFTLGLSLFLLVASYVNSQVPQLLNYQGRLVKADGKAEEGTFTMVFVIYSDSIGTNQLWTATHNAVTVTKGVFNVLLNVPGSLFAGSGDRYLGIKVGTEAEMRPLFRLTSVAYAIRAHHSDTAQVALSNGRVISGNSLDAKDGNPTDVVYVDENGDVGIGTTDPSATLHLESNTETNILLKTTGAASTRIRLQPATNGIGALQNLAGDLNISSLNAIRVGTGSGGYLDGGFNERFTILPGGNVGIKTTTPQAELDVNVGTFRLGSALYSSGYFSGRAIISSDGIDTDLIPAKDDVGEVRIRDGNGAGAMAFSNAGNSFINSYSDIQSRNASSLLFQTKGGNVGIGTTNPISKLDVRGNVHVEGNVQVGGTLTKGGGAFKIDHPLDPANKYLYHSFVESPDMKNIYDGKVVLDQNGEAIVALPDWFEALNKDFCYQLTCIGGSAPVYIAEEISNNQFKISGGKPGMKICWQVTGIRHDGFAEKYRIQVEEMKPDRERGKYLHPEAFGLSETLGVGYENSKQK